MIPSLWWRLPCILFAFLQVTAHMFRNGSEVVVDVTLHFVCNFTGYRVHVPSDGGNQIPTQNAPERGMNTLPSEDLPKTSRKPSEEVA